TDTCPYCQRAEKLLTKKGVEITKINVEGNQAALREMIKRTGRNTVPQIFIGDRHVGGFDDLAELDMDDELDPLLAG
ncbi:MAG TPA: glutaredoxin 3, partial [Gammaproteobacteria bacterium]|nr:glutaredoxin 3 [Gammaproteobacteria bacterium]